MNPTWYDLLGVEPSATTDDIRAAWKSAIADLDPTERRFATLNQAAAVLLDPARRSEYDAELDAAAEAEAEASALEAEADEPEPDAGTAADTEPGEPEAAGAQSPVEETTEAEPEAGAPSPRRAPYLVPGWVLAVVAVLALVAAATAGVLAAHQPADKIIEADATVSTGSKVTQIEQRAMEAQAAAREAIVPLLSYDYRHLDADQAKAEKYLTASYKVSYDKLFTLIKQNAPASQAVVTTKVVDSGIVRVDGDRVQVLLFVDRPTTNKASSTPIPYQDQVTATMRDVAGRWLIDNLVTTPIQQ